MAKPIGHLLVDTSAFIKLSQLHQWSEDIGTVAGVVEEIRNKDSRIALTSLLPYTLHVKNPSEKSLQHVIDFAKKTGDFPALSRTDLVVIAATYELECIHGVNKGENLLSQPKRSLNAEPVSFAKILKELPAHQIGFYDGESGKCETSQDPQTSESIGNETKTGILEINKGISAMQIDDSVHPMEHSRNMDSSAEESVESSDDGEGWITSSNISDVTTLLGGTIQETPHDIQVACITSDFAIQNVLLQMGLQVLSIDGMLITQVRRYALQCRVCMKNTFQMETKKCTGCGYDLLIRVHAITENGGITYKPLSVKQFSKRGLRFSTPKPIGGRHGNVSTNPRNKPRYSRKVESVNPLDIDYVARESPFKYKDVHSRGANIGFKMGPRRTSKNPNEVAKKGTRRKSRRI